MKEKHVVSPYHKQELSMQTLSDWQIVLLDNGIWILLTLVILALAVFPWKHWNSLIEGENNG